MRLDIPETFGSETFEITDLDPGIYMVRYGFWNVQAGDNDEGATFQLEFVDPLSNTQTPYMGGASGAEGSMGLTGNPFIPANVIVMVKGSGPAYFHVNVTGTFISQQGSYQGYLYTTGVQGDS